MDERKRRLFAGIALNDATRTRCAAVSERLRATGFAGRYEAPEKLHVTLAFLGYVTASRSEEIAAAVADSAAKCAPFVVTLDKLGGFPHERRPRVVYLGARDQGARYRVAAAQLRDALIGLGFAFKDDAVAHVTIARVKAPHRSLPAVEFEPIELRVNSLTLFESLPDKANNTSRYERVMSAPLYR